MDDIERRFEYLERRMLEVVTDLGIAIERIGALESRLPDPGPIIEKRPPIDRERGRWDWVDGVGLTYDGVPQDIEISTLLNINGLRPDSNPIDREQGRELVRDFDKIVNDRLRLSVAAAMRDWIASVCKEDE